ncbi:MAG TPA: RHS repeat-associated core domain-containing protein [Candidatus Dormibacteraeota bacterium]|nr:RHS repeat-associated core domain-containing protein [Candidatus Dormibacteraeota bacterium]
MGAIEFRGVRGRRRGLAGRGRRHLASLLIPAVVVGTLTFVATPLVSTRTAQAAPILQGELYGVSCASASNCWAVGDDGIVNNPVSEHYDGSAWSVVPTGAGNGTQASLQGVSCIGSECWAVGYHSGPRTLIEHYTTSAGWVVVNSADEGANGDYLWAVACTSGTACWAAGDYLDANRNTQTLIEYYNGTSWSIINSPNPGTSSALVGVACVAATDCWAVGHTDSQTLTEHYDGSAWTVVSSPNVANMNSNGLAAVTCVSSSDCWTIGEAVPNSGIFQTLAEHWDGTTWTIFATPTIGVPQGPYLRGVACSASNDCWAVGNYDGSVEYYTLTDHWYGTSWSVVSSPAVPDTSSLLNAVTCTSTSNCWAVGRYPWTNGIQRALILHWTNGAWIIDGSPIGGNVTAQENPGGGNPSEPWACSSQGSAGDPCNTASGAFSETAADLAVPGRGIPLSLTRSYSSVFAGTNGPLGYGWTDSYNMSLSVNGTTGAVTISQENASQVAFTPASGGGYTAPPRIIATLTHNGDGTYTFVRQARETFVFSSAGQLTSERDLNGYTTWLAYNESGQLSTVTDPASRQLTFGYTGTHLTSITDPASRTVSYGYDGSGNLSQVTDVAGGVTKFTYDANHLLLTITDPRGGAVTNVYDTSRRVSSQKDQLNRTTTFGYSGDYTSATGGTTTITDPAAHQTQEQYTFGERTAVTKGYGTSSAATTQYAYDPSTLAPTSITDPNGHTAKFTYDASGNQLSMRDPLGRQTTATYNSFNEPLTKTDALGVTTTSAYDASGNLTQRSTPLVGSSPAVSQTTTYTYGDSSHPGDVTAVTNADGKPTHLAYDTYGDLASSADPLGDTTTYGYNTIGWLMSSVSPKGNVPGCGCATAYTTAYGHNARGQVTTTTDPLGHVTTKHYDADGNLDQLTDGDGNLTTYVYDAANEQTQVQRADTPQTTLVTDYNPDGTVLDQKDGAGNTTTYGYDALGRVTSVTTPATAACASGCTTRYSYDGAGNRLSTVDPTGATTTSAYDAANELTSVTYSDGVTPNVTAITYDADGQQTAMTDGTGTSHWAYDSLRRLTSYTNGAGATVGYGYTTPSGVQDLLDQVGHLTYPNSAGTVARAYDDAGRLTSVTDWNGTTISFGYDANSNLTSSSVPSATPVTDTMTFNAADQVASTGTSNGTTLFSASYTRDGNGQLTSDSSVPATVGAFRYTALNQLCYAGSSAATGCASPPTGSQPFAYDAADNLTTFGGTTQKFDAANELCWTSPSTSANTCSSTPTGGTAFGYDGLGNRTSLVPPTGPATCDRYDQANRLASIVSGTGSTCSSPTTTGTYGYDGEGLRQSKTVGGMTTSFAWDVIGPLPLLLQESTSSGTTNYIYGPGGEPVEQLTPGPAISFVGAAHGGNPATTLSSTANVPYPTGIHASDQLLLSATFPAGAANSVTAPSGFSQVGSPVVSGVGPTADELVLFRKTALGTESGTLSVSFSGPFASALELVAYRGVDPLAPIDFVQSNTATNASTVSTGTATAHYAGERLVAFDGATYIGQGPQGWHVSPGMSLQDNAPTNATISACVADVQVSAAGTVGPYTSTFGTPPGSTNGQLATIFLGLKQPPVLYFHHDQLGSTRLLTDQAGVARATFTYDPFGNITAQTGTATTPVLYAGQYRDAESGLYYLRARYYDPSTGSFLSRDPLAEQTREPYTYVYSDPLHNSDLSGLDCGIFSPGDCLGDIVGAVDDGLKATGNAIKTSLLMAGDAVAGVISKAGGAVAVGASGAAAICAVGALPSIFGEAVCGATEGMAIGAGAATTGADAYLALRGKGSWGAVGLDGIALIFGGVGRWGRGFDSAAESEYAGSATGSQYASALSFGTSAFAWLLALGAETQPAEAACTP